MTASPSRVSTKGSIKDQRIASEASLENLGAVALDERVVVPAGCHGHCDGRRGAILPVCIARMMRIVWAL